MMKMPLFGKGTKSPAEVARILKESDILGLRGLGFIILYYGVNHDKFRNILRVCPRVSGPSAAARTG